MVVGSWLGLNNLGLIDISLDGEVRRRASLREDVVADRGSGTSDHTGGTFWPLLPRWKLELVLLRYHPDWHRHGEGTFFLRSLAPFLDRPSSTAAPPFLLPSIPSHGVPLATGHPVLTPFAVRNIYHADGGPRSISKIPSRENEASTRRVLLRPRHGTVDTVVAECYSLSEIFFLGTDCWVPTGIMAQLATFLLRAHNVHWQVFLRAPYMVKKSHGRWTRR